MDNNQDDPLPPSQGGSAGRPQQRPFDPPVGIGRSDEATEEISMLRRQAAEQRAVTKRTTSRARRRKDAEPSKDDPKAPDEILATRMGRKYAMLVNACFDKFTFNNDISDEYNHNDLKQRWTTRRQQGNLQELILWPDKEQLLRGVLHDERLQSAFCAGVGGIRATTWNRVKKHKADILQGYQWEEGTVQHQPWALALRGEKKDGTYRATCRVLFPLDWDGEDLTLIFRSSAVEVVLCDILFAGVQPVFDEGLLAKSAWEASASGCAAKKYGIQVISNALIAFAALMVWKLVVPTEDHNHHSEATMYDKWRARLQMLEANKVEYEPQSEGPYAVTTHSFNERLLRGASGSGTTRQEESDTGGATVDAQRDKDSDDEFQRQLEQRASARKEAPESINIQDQSNEGPQAPSTVPSPPPHTHFPPHIEPPALGLSQQSPASALNMSGVSVTSSPTSSSVNTSQPASLQVRLQGSRNSLLDGAEDDPTELFRIPLGTNPPANVRPPQGNGIPGGAGESGRGGCGGRGGRGGRSGRGRCGGQRGGHGSSQGSGRNQNDQGAADPETSEDVEDERLQRRRSPVGDNGASSPGSEDDVGPPPKKKKSKTPKRLRRPPK